MNQGVNRMKKKIVIGLVIIAVLAGGVLAFLTFEKGRSAQAADANRSVASIGTGDLTATISATGKVRSSQNVSLNWLTSGAVEEVLVSVGDVVQAGDQLATLERSSLPQSVILAQADLYNAQEALDNLYTEANVSSTKAMQEIAAYEKEVRDAQYQLDNFTVPSDMADMDTVEALDAMKAIQLQASLDFEPYKYYSETDDTREELKDALDDAQADYNSAVKRLQYEYDLQVAQDNLDRAHEDYEEYKDGPDPAEVDALNAKIEAAEAVISQAWIKSSISGVVTDVKNQAGDRVLQNQASFRIDDLSSIYVDVEVSEVDIDQVQVGQPVKISLDGVRDREYQGVVSEVALISSETSNAVDFLVTVELTDPDESVRPGMTAEVEIEVAQLSDVVLIPNQAVRVEDGKQVVYVLQADGSSLPVEVGLGISSETFSQLVSGDVQPGDQVVLSLPESDSEEANMMMMGPRPADGGSPTGGQQ